MPSTTNAGARIWWDECGSGEPLLLVMGHAFTSSGWHRVLPGLSERFRVLLFDNRGVGRSDVPNGPYDIRTMAGDALAVLDAAGVQRAHVFGISMGGLIAQHLAIEHAHRVDHLVLGCTACHAPRAQRGRGQHLLRQILPARVIQRLSTPILYAAGTPRTLVDEDFALFSQDKPKARGLTGQAEAVAAYTTCDRLGEISAPTLILHGAQDRLVPIERGEELASKIPGALLARLDNAGHVFTTDATDATVTTVTAFLQPAPVG